MRKKINPADRMHPVSISLHPSDLIVLDKLADAQNMSRSKFITSIIKMKGIKELGVKASEKHVAPTQNWNGKKTIEMRACNPHHKDGMCKHHVCQAVYKKEGLL